jgi:hypothetical protein
MIVEQKISDNAKIVDIDSSAMFAEKKICKLFFSDNHSSCPLVDKF